MVASRVLLNPGPPWRSWEVKKGCEGRGQPQGHVSLATWALRSVQCEWWSHAPRVQCGAQWARRKRWLLCAPGALAPSDQPGLEFKSSEKARWLSWGSLWVRQRRLNTDLELAGEQRGRAAQYPRCSGTWGRADARRGLGLPQPEWAHGFGKIAGHFGANEATVLEKSHTFW